MKELQNKPAVTIALLVVLVGALAVTFLRIKGNTAAAGNRGVVQEQQAAARPKYIPPMDDIPPERDPFGHSVLNAQPVDSGRLPGRMTDPQSATDRHLPMLPFGIEEMKPRDVQISPVPPGDRPSTASKPVPNSPSIAAPTFRLQAVVSGSNPLAVIKDSAGKSHFVHEGDQLGDGAIVARIINGTVAVRYGGSFSILSLERGSGGNEKNQ